MSNLTNDKQEYRLVNSRDLKFLLGNAGNDSVILLLRIRCSTKSIESHFAKACYISSMENTVSNTLFQILQNPPSYPSLSK